MNYQTLHNVVILGAGESGVGAAILAKQRGHSVFVSDLGKIKDEYIQQLAAHGIPFEEEKHSVHKILLTAQLAIKSPGIPDKADLVVQLREKGVPVIDEIEFAHFYARQTPETQIVAITGSNGKTTTTRLVHHLLETAGLDAALVGNVGYSFAKRVAENPAKIYVIEASSFQLDGTQGFRPDVAILLNITPDHLDRYGYHLPNYIASKLRIVRNQQPADTFIYGNEDENIRYGLEHFYPHPTPHQTHLHVPLSAIFNDDPILRVPNSDFSIEKAQLTLQGKHNFFNIAAAVLAARRFGVGAEALQKGLSTFVNEAHRLEKVVEINGIEFINDSKATNVDSVFYALDAMTKPVVWIVGGQDKGNDYSPLFELVRQKVKAIVCLGLDNSKIRASFEPIQPIIEETISIPEAIKVSTLYAEPGDVVLLSPACASFDLFKNYRDRGDQFKNTLHEQVRIMKEGIRVTINLNLNPDERRSDS